MRVAVLSVALSLALFASPGWAQKAGPAAAQASADDPEANEAAVSKMPLDEIRRFVAVYNAVKQAYVDPVEDKKLMHAAVRGLLSDLDPHSTYFDKEDAEAFDEQATGAYDGIGVELLQQQQDNTLKVIAPIDDTPAARAGIRAGDVIVAIDGKPIDASKAMEPLRGESGSKVVLTIMRDKTPKPFDVTLQRETIRVASVRSKLLEPGYGYIRISTFQADTGADFQKNLKQLQAGGKLRGLVLDLRSNPGGLLTSAVQVADDLLDKGNIVSTRGRISISDAKFDATPGDLLNGAPVVVLVDAGSASASEVLAGALRDNKRARIIGSRTFGKGSVQTVLPLDNGDSVKLTTARYYTPSGKSIQASGIVPDVLLAPEPQPGDADAPASLTDYSEATLPGHLRGDDEGEEGYSAGDVLPGDGPITEALAELKQPGAAAKAQAARKAKAQAAQKAKAAKTGAEPKPAAARPATTDKPRSAEPAGKAKPATAPAAPAEPVQPTPPADKPAEPVN
ncbi:S41 family peptidase [Xanthomonas citri]|uniref:S41 family peptidase n=1 Tax=Xanthomonas citri TaxID=346 RepID=UPI0001CECDF0|nr:S41 family peptidase [Xanthomonas citri]AMU96713.1 peptidase S41 [Xanthomonas citri pv. aurantifolii]AMV01059.1 peptidase S41 [Xanthomonas citri pv. aurantifolii]EFF48093.1 carboxyl-terminal protease [Xanthomonas citri pv. aurantifolii str. ICPB 10535]MCC8491782.1 S41 family peptidase [Xanthomonas citri pv. fuscans]TBW98200.1 peptidase S41 [Xanthomonas citri pv. aurantifolii]